MAASASRFGLFALVGAALLGSGGVVGCDATNGKLAEANIGTMERCWLITI